MMENSNKDHLKEMAKLAIKMDKLSKEYLKTIKLSMVKLNILMVIFLKVVSKITKKVDKASINIVREMYTKEILKKD